MIGRTLDHYRIESKLGEGGMGVVYRAPTRIWAAPSPSKILPAEKVLDPAGKERFSRGAGRRALNHPNIITIHDIGRPTGSSTSSSWSTSRAGLDEVIPHGGMPCSQALDFAVQIADALDVAHERGHRPSRHQARQHHAHPRRAREGARLRAGQAAGSGESRRYGGDGAPATEDRRVSARRLHVAGAGRGTRGRRPHRHLRFGASCTRCSPAGGPSPAIRGSPS